MGKSALWNLFTKVLASGLVIWQAFHYMQTEPFMDAINGLICGAVFYAIWFARERGT